MTQQPNPEVQIMQSLNDLGGTVNVLEDRYRLLRKKIKVADENLLSAEKALAKEMQLINEELVDLKTKMTRLSEKIGQAFEDSKHLVKRHEFLELKKYVEFWNPIDFLTVKEAKELTQNLNKDGVK